MNEGFTLLDVGAVAFGDHRPDHHIVALKFAAFSVVHANRTILVQRDPTAVEGLDSAQIIEAHRAVVLRLDNRLLESLAGSAADVKCAHRQLGSRLAN